MSTNKKITQLDELTPATWADDDVIAIVDISAQETKKIQLSTFRTAVGGVTTLTATTPLTVDTSLGDVTISVAISGGGTVNAVLDEDNMASNSPTALSTQQSIKAYVDSQIITVDSLSEVLALGNTSGGTNLIVSSGDVLTTNTINETTAASGVTIETVLIKDGEVVATGFTGTLDGVLGGGTPAAITGTALTLTTGATVTTVLDEDNMASNSATALATQQSIKAYVDAEVGTADTLSEVLALGNTTGGTDIAMTGGDKVTNFTSTGIDDNATSTAITIDSSENVGIGTASPTEKLEVTGNLILDATDANIKLKSGGAGTTGAVNWTFNTDSTVYGSISLPYDTRATVGLKLDSVTYPITLDSGNGIIFQEDGSETVRISSAGYVGIGTTAPSTKLQLTGSADSIIRLEDTATIGAVDRKVGGIEFYQNDVSGGAGIGSSIAAHHVNISGDTDLRFATGDNTERMRINSSGNVGIGTTTPLSAAGYGWLTINGASAGGIVSLSNADTELFRLQAANSSTLLSTLTAAPLLFKTNNAESMRITSAGDVGIGITAPATKFHVLDGTSSLRFRQNGTVSETLIVGPSGGDAALYFGDTVDTARGGLYYDTSENALQIRGYNNSARMAITSAGNVGIGTASPAVPLDVVGNIRSSTGVLFGTDTAAANLLDDYEEGDWTPTIGTGATVSPDATYNAGFTAGKYTKVGRVVHCSATLRLTDKGTQSGNISILGLPFTSANNVGSRATWSLWFHGAADLDLTGNTDGTIMMYQAHNTAYIQVRVKDPATAAAENVAFADISDTVYVQISGSYVAA